MACRNRSREAVVSPISLAWAARRFSASELPDVVYLEQMLTAVYLNRPADTASYLDVLNRLAAQAEDLDATAATLERILTGRP